MFIHDLHARQVPKSKGTKKTKSRVTRKKSKGKKASFKVNGGGPGLKVGKNKEKDSLTYKGTYDLSNSQQVRSLTHQSPTRAPIATP